MTITIALERIESDLAAGQYESGQELDRFLALIRCTRALDAMRDRFYCPKDPVYQEAVAALKQVEGL